MADIFEGFGCILPADVEEDFFTATMDLLAWKYWIEALKRQATKRATVHVNVGPFVSGGFDRLPVGEVGK